MNLAIDIGNSQAKATIFDEGGIIGRLTSGFADSDFVEEIFETFPNIRAAIISSTRKDNREIEQDVEQRVGRFITFNTSVVTPLKNLYSTPLTLGSDRLAAAVGAESLFPKTNLLVVDFGTAITIDFVSERGEYCGGNISPGAELRFRALHEFTNKLPLQDLTDDAEILGKSTESAIESGVINGIIMEIEGYITLLSERHKNLKVIFTGGDSNFFAKRLKNPIFASYDLVAIGLNRILEYNAE